MKPEVRLSNLPRSSQLITAESDLEAKSSWLRATLVSAPYPSDRSGYVFLKYEMPGEEWSLAYLFIDSENRIKINEL